MKKVTFVPGATTAGDTLTLPVPVPDIAAVIAASITRMPLTMGTAIHASAAVAAGFGNHTQDQVVACLDNHSQAQIVAAFAAHDMADVALGVGNHTQAQVFPTIADHAVHAHDLLVIVGIVAEAFGATGIGNADMGSVTGQTVVGGSAVNGGVQDNAAVQDHAGSGTDLAHDAGADLVHAGAANPAHVGVADLAHVGGVAVAHGAAANPVVAVTTVTRLTARTFQIDVDTVLGDLLDLVYYEVGERVAVA